MQTGRTHRNRGMVDTVLKYLQAGNELTADKAIDLWREANVRNKISQLRSEGYSIGSREEKSKRGGKYKVYFLVNGTASQADKKENYAYWKSFFNGVGQPLGDDLAKAMLKVYVDTGKDYSEIWPEPGTSVFQPIWESYELEFVAPQKASA